MLSKRILVLMFLLLFLPLVGCLPGLTPSTPDGISTGTITGVINGSPGVPLAGANVSIEGTELSTTTNSSGDYTLSDVPPGLRYLIVTYQGGQIKKKVTVTAGITITLNISFPQEQPETKPVIDYYVDPTGTDDETYGTGTGNAAFKTIQYAINDSRVVAGNTIDVAARTYAGAIVDRGVKIIGAADGTSIITSGPVHGSGLIQGFLIKSDGVTISHFTFEVDFAIMNGASSNDVTIEYNVFNDPIQGISNWGGSGWQISYNEINDLRASGGGGTGILIADWTGGDVNDNLVSHNEITGTLHVKPGDGGGYNGNGIVLYADFRWGADGANEIAYNRVVQNKISLTSDTPGVVDVVAIELTDTRDNPSAVPYPVIFDNTIEFNDLQDTVLKIILTPEELGDCNDISQNLKENRSHGHGLQPSVFSPE